MAKRMGRSMTRTFNRRVSERLSVDRRYEIYRLAYEWAKPESAEQFLAEAQEIRRCAREWVRQELVEQRRFRQYRAQEQRRRYAKLWREGLQPITPVAFPVRIRRYMDGDTQVRYVSVYHVSREYGGAEEGGWWYDCYTVECRVPVRTAAHAARVAEELAHAYGSDHKPREYTSVLSSGMYEVHYESVKGQHETKHRPYYE
jgi:hypothetical protein